MNSTSWTLKLVVYSSISDPIISRRVKYIYSKSLAVHWADPFTPSLSLRSQSDFHFGHRRNFTISWFWAELKLTWLDIAAILKIMNTTTPEEFQLIDTSCLSSRYSRSIHQVCWKSTLYFIHPLCSMRTVQVNKYWFPLRRQVFSFILSFFFFSILASSGFHGPHTLLSCRSSQKVCEKIWLWNGNMVGLIFRLPSAKSW